MKLPSCWRWEGKYAVFYQLPLYFLQGKQYLYAGSNTGVVQSPVAFCEKYSTCVDCVLARDPYCGWNSHKSVCTDIFKESENNR